ncbi:MAG: amino acid permease [Candidatus Aminicenantes bacterium]|nr:amino acid permease [Candidatus Aminicenantes bacterium]
MKKPNSLERRLGLFPVTNIVVANMIGAGIFTTSGLLMEQLRHPLLLLGLWAVGGLIALAGAFSYSELGAAFPHAGGEYLFLSRLYHPLLGFLSGWVSFFVGFSAPIAAAAIGLTEYLARAFPEILNVAGIPGALMMRLYALSAILLFTLLHLQGLRWGARIQNILTALKVGLIAALLIAGLTRSGGDWSHFTAAGSFRFDLGGWKVIGLSLMWILFSYSGWNAAAYIGSEVLDPARNIPRSLLMGTGAVILLYAGLNVFYIYALPAAEMSGVIPVGSLAAGRLFGASSTRLITLLIAFAQFSSLSAFILLGPRVYYSMARDGLFFKKVAEVHPRRRVPSTSILLQAAIAGVIVFSGSFDQILTYMGFSLGIFPLLAVLGVFVLRRRQKPPYRMPGFPVFPLIYLLAGVSILALGFMERPVPSSIALLTVALGVPAYFVFRRTASS